MPASARPAVSPSRPAAQVFVPGSALLGLAVTAALLASTSARADDAAASDSDGLEPVITVIGDRIRLDSIPGSAYGHRRRHSHRVPRLHHQRSDAQSARGVRARRGRARPAAEPGRPRPQPDPLGQGAAARRRHSDRLCPVWRQRDLLPPAGRSLRAHRGPEGLRPDRLRTAHGRRGDQLHHATGAGRPHRPARRFVRQQGLPRDPR